MIVGYRMQRVLIDNGSSADSLCLPTCKQMGILEDRLQPIGVPLVGFTGNKIFPLGSIALSVTTGLEVQVTKEVVFLVVNFLSAYYAILGRPSLNQMKAVTDTYHLIMRFPINHRVGEVRGD